MKIISSTSELEPIRAIWEKLQWNPYWDLDYLLWKYAQPGCVEKPYVLELSGRDGNPVIIAGEIESVPIRANFGYKYWKGPSLKTLVIKRYGILGDADIGIWNEVEEHIRALLTRGEIEAATFQGFDASKAPSTLSFHGLPQPCRYRIDFFQEHWLVDSPDGLGAHKSRHRNFWQNFRRSRNKIRRRFGERVQIVSYVTSGDLSRILTDTEDVAQKTWQRKLGWQTLPFTSQEVRNRYEYLLERGLLRANLVYLDGKPAAFFNGIEYLGQFYWEVTGYDPQYSDLGIGTFLTGHFIEEHLKAGDSLGFIDCGVGNSEAKTHFCDRFFLAAERYLVAPRVRLMKLNTLRAAILKSHLILKQVSGRVGLYHKIRSAWRYGLGKGSKRSL